MSTITRMTLEEYERMPPLEMIRGAEPRTELIRGELRFMNPISPPHAYAVDWLTEWSFRAISIDQVRVRTQQPLRMAASESEPRPDVTWVTQQNYRKRHPTPEDVLLVIEVADSSLAYDRREKAELYADAEIEEYWIANIPGQCVEVLRKPENGKYQSVQSFSWGESVQALRCPEAILKVDMLYASEVE